MPVKYKHHLEGQRFGRITILERVKLSYPSASSVVGWKYRCDCGKERISTQRHILNGHVTGCGCIHAPRKGKPASFGRILTSYKQNAKNKKREYTLSDEEFEKLVFNNCYYCGQEPNAISTSSRKNGYVNPLLPVTVYNGIDRMDSNLGYTKENCVSCCKMCNVAKMAHNKDEFLAWVTRVYKHQNRTFLATY